LQGDHYPSVTLVEGYSAADISRMQREDVDIGAVIKWLENKVEPGKSQFHLGNRAIKALWLMKQRLCIKKLMYCTMSGQIRLTEGYDL
jgi:hypothetical protein